MNRGPFSLEVGKQFIRWGKADILNPTDRFAPRDYLTVVDNDFLGVTGARAIYESGSETVDLVWVPRFTPSRTPLLKQRWTVLPPLLAEHFFIADYGAVFPKRSEFGARWNHNGSGYEFSLSFYDGFDHLPLVLSIPPPMLGRIDLVRTYPADEDVRWRCRRAPPLVHRQRRSRLLHEPDTGSRRIRHLRHPARTAGWRVALWWAATPGISSRARRRGSSAPAFPWSTQIEQGQFSPERGLARSFLGRIAYTIAANRELVVETAVRRDRPRQLG